MNTLTPKARATAHDMLRLHGGRCSVSRNSPLHLAFCEMQEKGEVRISRSGTPDYVDIQGKESHEKHQPA